MYAALCLPKHFSQWLKYGNSLNIHGQVNGKRCGAYIHWSTTQPQKDEILPFVTTWVDLEGIILNKVTQMQKKSHKIHVILLICKI